MLGNFNQQFNSIFGVPSHRYKANLGESSFNEDDLEELEEEEELDFDDDNFDDDNFDGSIQYEDDPEFFDLQDSAYD